MDELLLSNIRLAVIAELLGSEWATFAALQKSINTTNGNLGAHLGKLVQAGYIGEDKSIVDRRPQTRYRLTEVGRDAFKAHVAELQELLNRS